MTEVAILERLEAFCNYMPTSEESELILNYRKNEGIERPNSVLYRFSEYCLN